MNIKTNLKKVACGVLSAAMLLAVAPKFSFAADDCNLGTAVTKFDSIAGTPKFNSVQSIGYGTVDGEKKYITDDGTVALNNPTNGKTWVEYDGTNFYCDGVKISLSVSLASGDHVYVKGDHAQAYEYNSGWGQPVSASTLTTEKFVEAKVNTIDDEQFLIKTDAGDYTVYTMAKAPKEFKSVKIYCDNEDKARVDF